MDSGRAMRGLMLFGAGMVCGGALIAWLFLGRDDDVPAAPASTLPMPAATADGATGLTPGERDLARPGPGAVPVVPPPVDVDPLERVPVPAPAAPTLATPDAPAGDATTPETVPPATGEDAATVPESKAADAAPQAAVPPDPEALAALRRMPLALPVQGITAADLDDTYSDARGEGRSHDAIDIMAPTGRPVLAVADGKIAKLFASVPGGLTIYQFDAGERVAFYYAHLDRYAADLEEGHVVKRGDVIGYVGSSGNANPAAPHLHFAIFVLGPEKQWWKGTAVNPYPVLKRVADAGAR